MQPCSIILLIFLDITVILPFIRTLKTQRQITRTKPIRVPTLTSTESQSFGVVEEPLPYMSTRGSVFCPLFLNDSPLADEKRAINTQEALSLPGKYRLFFVSNSC